MTKSPRLPRFFAIIAVSALALSSCGGSSPVASANDAFVVNGASFSLDTFETLLDDLVENQLLEAGPNNQVSKESAVSVMRTLIRFRAYEQYMIENDLTEDPADRKKVLEQSAADEAFGTLPEYLQELLINLSVAQATMAKFTAPSAATLKKLYNEMPASTGVMCLSHILVKTEDEALDALKELSNGAQFEAVARKKSIEPNAQESGGALETADEPCTDLAYFQQQFDADFLTAAVAAKAGVPTGPIKTQFGFHVILNRPYDTIKDSLARVAASQPSVSNIVGFTAASDISVNSKYGVWNGAMATLK